jgi:hypothetical protein
MAQNDFGWGSSQWRNRPMSTEIGDHNEPFQYQRPRLQKQPAGPPPMAVPAWQQNQPTGITPTVQPPPDLPPTLPTAQPPSALPPTAPIGQMPSPQWANPPDFNDNRVTTMPARTEPVGQETVMDADSFPGIPPAAQTPPAIAYPGRRPTIGYPGGPNPGPAVEIPGGVWGPDVPHMGGRAPSLRDLLRSGEQRVSNLRNDQRRISALEAPRNRPWSTEAIGDQGDPSIPAPNLGRPNLFYGRGYPEPMEIDYQRQRDRFRRGGPGNAYGWGGRNFRRF